MQQSNTNLYKQIKDKECMVEVNMLTASLSFMLFFFVHSLIHRKLLKPYFETTKKNFLRINILFVIMLVIQILLIVMFICFGDIAISNATTPSIIYAIVIFSLVSLYYLYIICENFYIRFKK